LAQTDSIEPVMQQIVSKIPENENDDISIKELHLEVLDLYDKHKQSRQFST
jgi:hypothetical protein